MRVLVTGHRGYIGAVLVEVLRHARHDVVGLDCNLYGDCDFGRTREDVPSFETDLREIEFADLVSFDAVIHLAGLPEDPETLLPPEVTWAVNFGATVRLAECCKQAGVGRFLFASTCAVYGGGGQRPQTEGSSPDPLTGYARAKLACEAALGPLADGSFTPVILRNGTVYGVSPRLRLDTVVNDFVGSAVTRGRVDMQTQGRAWRPLVHVEDVARVYTAMLTARDEAVGRQIFNVATTEENYRVIDVADAVTELVPNCVRSVRAAQLDRRSYLVDGSKLRRTLPDFAWRWTLLQGIRQLRAALAGAGLSAGDWRGEKYRRVLRIAGRMERAELNGNCRVRSTPSAANI
jgi:nucleoside-diphosphate-sugar epimerase